MSALNPLNYKADPKKLSRKPRKISNKHQERYHKIIAAETTTKLVVNGLLSVAAITAGLKLFPYHLQQQAKLKEVRTEVEATETRVNHLRENFSTSFDSTHSKIVMQQQSPRVDPNQRRIFLLEQK